MARRVRLKRRRERGAYTPSGERGAWFGLCACPHHEERHVRAGSRKREPSRGDKVEHFRRAPRLDDHGAKRRTSRCLLPRTQYGRAITRADEDEPVRGETKLVEAGRVDLAHFNADKILAHPHDGTPGGGAYRQHHAEACSRRFISRLRSEYLVQRAAIEAALQRCIDLRRAGAEAIGRSGG